MKKSIDEILGKDRHPATPPLEKLLEIVPNRYLLVNIIAKRAHDLHEGADPLIECDPERDSPIDIAIAELLAGKIAPIQPEKTYEELMSTEDVEWEEVELDET